MKKNILFIFTVFIYNFLFAQKDSTGFPPPPTNKNTKKGIYEKIDSTGFAEYPGGEDAFKIFITTITEKIADSARRANIKATTYNLDVSFLVDTSGFITDVKTTCNPKSTFFDEILKRS
jgi:hypothetical protein